MFKILSTFTGAGGLDIGFHGNFTYLGNKCERLKFETTLSIDINKDACETIKNNARYFSNTEALNADIISYDISKIPNLEYDVLLGGFPCVTFSVVGKQLGVKDDINGKLYLKYAEYVEKFKPKVFLAENVKGILSANKGEAVKQIKKRFEETGYTLSIFLVNFAQFGVPQQRERVLFVGVRDDIPQIFIPPEITHQKFDDYIKVKDAFKDISDELPNTKRMKQAGKTTKMLEAIPEGGNFKDLPSELAVKGLMSNIYRKLDRNKPAYTVIASGGGGTWTYHYEEPRAITNRERARLQGFPDDLEFFGSNTEVRRQIGNAVPPVGIHPFAKNIQALLEGKQLLASSKTLPEYDIEQRKLKKISADNEAIPKQATK